MMELKTARLTLLIDPHKKAVFERLCASQDRTASQVVRQLIRDYLVEHGVELGTSGVRAPPTTSTEAKQSSPPPSKAARAGRKRGEQVSEPAPRPGAHRR